MGSGVSICFSTVVRSLCLFPQHPPSWLCQNYTDINRCVRYLYIYLIIHHHTCVIHCGLYNLSQVHGLHFHLKVNVTKIFLFYEFVCFLTEPKDDVAYRFIKSWIGKTARPTAYCGLSCLFSYTQNVCFCLQGMVYWYLKVKSGFATDGSWRQVSIMTFWRDTWIWCQILLKPCWYVHNKLFV